MRKSYFLFIALFFLAALTGRAQAQKLNGVYVGAELYSTPFNGMQINHIVIYFRNDGTLNNDLSTADWKSKVNGSYAIKGNVVQLSFKDARDNTRYTLASNGNLESTAGIKHTLHKVKPASSLSAATYEKKSASSSGGMGTGMPHVAAFSSNYLSFDGKGNFSFNHSGVVGIGGDVAGGTIGGKQENNSQTSGTYKLSDGEITLTFKDGTVSRQSFFYSPPNEEDLIVLGGAFYFREDDKEKKTATTEKANNTQGQRTTTNTGTLPTAAILLQQLRQQYGGENLDKINTVRETATLTGNLQAVMLTDIKQNKLRAELRQNGKLLLVKQLDGNVGWQWMNGVKKALSADEKADLQLGLYQGILGLHKGLNSYFLKGSVSRSDNDYLLTFFVDNHRLVYLIGPDYSLKANGYSINESRNFSVYKNFITSNGISYPAVTESSDGQHTIVMNTTKTEFNPVLTEEDWKTP
jgi:hypothetical protein